VVTYKNAETPSLYSSPWNTSFKIKIHLWKTLFFSCNILPSQQPKLQRNTAGGSKGHKAITIAARGYS